MSLILPKNVEGSIVEWVIVLLDCAECCVGKESIKEPYLFVALPESLCLQHSVNCWGSWR
jgi:hypothetical protein